MTGQQYTAIKLLLIGGKTQEEIAQEIGITSRTLRNWLSNDEFMKEYKQQQMILLNSLSAQAIQTLQELMMNSSSDNVRMNCAKDILSRCGFDAKQNISIDTPQEIIINIAGEE